MDSIFSLVIVNMMLECLISSGIPLVMEAEDITVIRITVIIRLANFLNLIKAEHYLRLIIRLDMAGILNKVIIEKPLNTVISIIVHSQELNLIGLFHHLGFIHMVEDIINSHLLVDINIRKGEGLTSPFLYLFF